MKSVWTPCAAIAVLYVVEVVAFTHALHYSIPMQHAGAFRLAAGVAALLQTGAIYWLYRSTQPLERFPYVPVLGCALVMAIASFAFVDPQRDALAYIAYAKQPTLASAYLIPANYVPPQGFAAIRRAWPSMPGCSYGPLWLWIAQETAGRASTVDGSMFVLRIIGILSLAAMFAAVLRLRAPPVAGALVVANPFWYFFYVLEAHNDGLAVMLTMGAAVLALPRPYLAPVVAGAAALIKAPFVLVAALAFTGGRSVRRRLPIQLAILAVVAAGGSLVGGRPYFRKLFSHGAQTYSLSHSAIGHAFSGIHIALAVVAAIAIVAALILSRFQQGASFSLIALSSFPYPWYLGWGLPYALNEPFIPGFFMLLPLFGFVLNSEPVAHVFEAVVLLVVAALAIRKIVPVSRLEASSA